MESYHQPRTSQQHNPNTVTVSRGAYAFVTILRPYMCATGPRAGWTKFYDYDKRAIINRHLEQDGKLPISRATYYRWKGEAKGAGLLDFASTAKRETVRRRARGGWWMRVTPAREVTVWGEGRRPRNAVSPARETFGSPPPDETFGSAPKEDLRDLSPLERSASDSAAARQKPAAPPTDSRDSWKKIPREAKAFCKKLTALAGIVDPDWEPDPAKERMRERATAKALRAIEEGNGERAELETMLVGLMKRRKREIENADERNEWHPFWEEQQGDPVARCCAYLAFRLESDYGIAEDLWTMGANELWRRWEIDANRLDDDEGLTIRDAA